MNIAEKRFQEHSAGWDVYKGERKIAELEFLQTDYPFYCFKLRSLSEDKSEIEQFFHSAMRPPYKDAYYKNRKTGVIISDAEFFGGMEDNVVRLRDYRTEPSTRLKSMSFVRNWSVG